MDYSLLFVIELNPTYVKFFPNEFEKVYKDPNQEPVLNGEDKNLI